MPVSRPLLAGRSAAVLLALGIALQAGPASADTNRATATFAGGCFWCMEPPYDEVEGVHSTVSGYANGHTDNPSYEQVTGGDTGHIEAVQVTYDPQQVSYQELLEIYWPNTDPLDGGGQFCDRGDSYRPAIFTAGEQQARLARQSLQRVLEQKQWDGEIRTLVEPLSSFWPAEDYHQDYYRKNPVRYKFYRWNCGRDERLDALWGNQRRLDLFPDGRADGH